MQETKLCCRCKNQVPLSDFNKCSSAKDGLDYSCKPCKNERVAFLRLKRKGLEGPAEDEKPKKFIDYLPEKLKWKISIQLIKATRGYANNKRHN